MGGLTRRFGVLLGAAVLAVAACGSDDDGGNTDVDVIRSEQTPLEAALAATAAAGGEPYRVSTSAAETMEIDALGIDFSSEIDEAQPASVLEVDRDGNQYLDLSLGSVFEGLTSANPELQESIASVGAEMWLVGDLMIIDSTGFQPIADLDPTADLGAFEPGIGTVDLAEIGEIGGPELVEVVAGSAPQDPAVLADRLVDTIDGLEQDPADPDVYRGRATTVEMWEAFGEDPEVSAFALASGFALSMDVDPQALADLYLELFRTLEDDITITIADGMLESIRVESDLTLALGAMVGSGSPLLEGISEAEIEATREIFADSVWTQVTLTSYEFDESIVIDPPDGDFEDRTQAILALVDGFGE